MISPRLFLLGTTLCLGACMGSGLPTIRPTAIQATERHQTLSERAFDQGKEHLAAGRAGLAIVAFERALRLDPTSVSALNGIGAAYDNLKRYDVALGYYKRALGLAPQSADTMNNIAVSLHLAGDPAANAWFVQAAKLDPDNETIAANIVQARAEDDTRGTVQGVKPPEPPAGLPIATVPITSVDAGAPSLRRTAVAEIQLETPRAPPAASTMTEPPAQAMLIPAVAKIEPPPPSRTETRDTPTPAPIQPRPIAAVTPVPAVAPIMAAPTTSPVATRDTPTAPIQPRPIAALTPVAAVTPMAAVAATASPAAKSAGQPAGAQAATAQVNVSNCVGRTRMARRFGAFLSAKALSVRRLTNAPPFDCEKSRLLARAGFELQAEAMARLLPVAIAIENNDTTTDDIRLVLGRDLVAFDRTLGD